MGLRFWPPTPRTFVRTDGRWRDPPQKSSSGRSPEELSIRSRKENEMKCSQFIFHVDNAIIRILELTELFIAF